jgi:hypothetical protein
MAISPYVSSIGLSGMDMRYWRVDELLAGRFHGSAEVLLGPAGQRCQLGGTLAVEIPFAAGFVQRWHPLNDIWTYCHKSICQLHSAYQELHVLLAGCFLGMPSTC